MKMKKLLIGALALVMVGALTSVANAEITRFYSNGTVTIKLDLDVPNAFDTSDDHAFDGAVKTPWVAVPTGIPFTIFVESQDLDSTTAFGPDSIHIGLETTCEGSLAHLTPALSGVGKRVVLLWTAGGPKFSLWGGSAAGVHTVSSRIGPQAHYFQNTPGDTTSQTVEVGVAAKDTVGSAAASLKDWAYFDPFGGAAKVQNLGMLRFSLCMGDDDSTADAAINMDCFIIYREDQAGKSHSSIETTLEYTRGGTFRDPAEYAEYNTDSFYGSHWARFSPFDKPSRPVRSLR